jgi:hypothetical protein
MRPNRLLLFQCSPGSDTEVPILTSSFPFAQNVDEEDYT